MLGRPMCYHRRQLGEVIWGILNGRISACLEVIWGMSAKLNLSPANSTVKRTKPEPRTGRRTLMSQKIGAALAGVALALFAFRADASEVKEISADEAKM